MLSLVMKGKAQEQAAKSGEQTHVVAPSEIALDPAIAKVVEAMRPSPYLDLDALPIEEALPLVRFPASTVPPPNSEDRRIDAGLNRDLRVRLYFPEGDRHDLPVLMHLHGGGFVTGTVEMDDARCGFLAREAGCIVASVDYALAPEYPFPAPIEDAFTAWRWITASAAEFGGDPHRVAVSGSSAGGHLAVGVSLLARDRKAQAPLLQLLTYPVIDPAFATASYRQFADGPFLTHARMAWFWKHYAGPAQPKGQLWSPLTGTLAGLPPALVITAEYDVLRDEAEAYVARLREAGIAADLHRHYKMIHGFLAIVPGHPESSLALHESASVLRKTFAAIVP
jgi:acetyl esterase